MNELPPSIRPLTITNCVFRQDSVAIGAYLDDYAQFSITGCRFYDNDRALDIESWAWPAVTSMTITDCEFSGHRGIIAVHLGEEAEGFAVINCAFRNNLGISLALSESFGTVIDCLFEGNLGHGVKVELGGVEISGSTFIGNSGTALCLEATSRPSKVQDCVFIGNSGMDGGAIHSTNYESLAITNCVFRNNSATNGGALYVLGAYRGMTIKNSIFANNSAAKGGALYLGGAVDPQTLVNCTLYGNSASLGGGIFVDSYPGSQFIVDRTIIAFGSQGEAVYCGTYSGPSTVNITCSDVYGNAGGDWVGCIAGQLTVPGGNNMSMDPLFCNPGDRDFTVGADSPCLEYSAFNKCNAQIGALGQGCDIPESALYRELSLQSHPNPFNPSTTIDYVLPQNGFVEIAVYDVGGHRVATLVSEEKPEGPNSVAWDGRNDHGDEVTSGIYFARLSFGSEVRSHKLALLK
jgi:predicted outer membrane repeat protein